MDIVFAEEDLNALVTESIRERNFDDRISVMDEDDADEYILNNTSGTLVSYVVAPSEPVIGSYCYKMLIDAHTHQLYYYKKHRITKKSGSGFLPEDIERITTYRR